MPGRPVAIDVPEINQKAVTLALGMGRNPPSPRRGCIPAPIP